MNVSSKKDSVEMKNCTICGQCVTSLIAPDKFAITCDNESCIIDRELRSIISKHDDGLPFNNQCDNYDFDRNYLCVICKEYRDGDGHPGFANTCSRTKCMQAFDDKLRFAIHDHIKKDYAAQSGRFVCKKCDHTFLPNDGNIDHVQCYDCTNNIRQVSSYLQGFDDYDYHDFT